MDHMHLALEVLLVTDVFLFFVGNMQDIPPPQADFSAPPPYDVAANSKLPTYEEVQREKQMEGEGIPQVIFISSQSDIPPNAALFYTCNACNYSLFLLLLL